MQKIIFGFSLLLLVSNYSWGDTCGILPLTKSSEGAPNGQQADTLTTDYGLFTFTNVASGKLMEVAGNIYYNEKYKEGAEVRQNTLSRSADGEGDGTDGWQKWQAIYQLTKDGVRYYAIRNVFSGLLLDVPGDSAVARRPLQQRSAFEKPNDEQLWSFHPAGAAGHFIILHKGTGWALCGAREAGAGAGSVTDSLPVVLARTDSSDAEQWVLQQQPAESYRDDAVVRFFNRNKRSQGSVAFDQGNSIPLNWGANRGKVLWITQDAWDGSSLQPNGKFTCTDYFHYRNSILIQPSAADWNPDHTLNITKTGSPQHQPKQIFDIVPHTEYAWPSTGVEIGQHVYIQCGEGSGLGPNYSQSLYDLTENEGSLWSVKRMTPAGMTGEQAINYSAGMVKAADGYVYVFGIHPTGVGYTVDVHVARFAATDPSSWTFWNGTAWAPTPVTGTGARIAAGHGTASIAYVKGKYVMISMDQGFNCDTARHIYVATADSPTGPFTALKKIYTIHEYFKGSYARYYTPVIHPEFDNGRQELLVTYCLNFSACGVESCVNGFQDPYFYRVKGIRVPYGIIGL